MLCTFAPLVINLDKNYFFFISKMTILASHLLAIIFCVGRIGALDQVRQRWTVFSSHFVLHQVELPLHLSKSVFPWLRGFLLSAFFALREGQLALFTPQWLFLVSSKQFGDSSSSYDKDFRFSFFVLLPLVDSIR